MMSLNNFEDASDKELISRLNENNVTAFNEIYWRYHHKIYRNIFKLTKEEDISKNLLQEVFIALWENRKKINSDKLISNWLFVVSNNKTFNHLKRIAREPIVFGETEMEVPFIDDLTDANLKESQLILLEEALIQLSTQKRKVIELCKLQGKSYEEAAKELNISKYTIKEYLSDAMSSIKNYIKNRTANESLLYASVLLIYFLTA